MQLSKEEYATKRICNGFPVRIENSISRDNYSASLGKPCDAEPLPSWQNFNPHLTIIKDSNILWQGKDVTQTKSRTWFSFSIVILNAENFCKKTV